MERKNTTGFIQLGNLCGTFVDERLAHQSGGKFFLRIEDTEDKRYVEGAVEIIINSLRFFDIQFDEGTTMDGDIGNYGDYTQSHRGPIYQCFAKKLVADGKGYPCFVTEEDIAEIYVQQIIQNISYFFDDLFEIEDTFPPETDGDVPTIIKKYLAIYEHKGDQEVWFGKIRQIADALGYAVKPKDFKKNPDQYKGHVGHVSTVIRVALMGRQQSPDVWEIQHILGEERTRARLSKFL